MAAVCSALGVPAAHLNLNPKRPQVVGSARARLASRPSLLCFREREETGQGHGLPINKSALEASGQRREIGASGLGTGRTGLEEDDMAKKMMTSRSEYQQYKRYGQYVG